jgi:hypothetical protein
MSDPIIKTFEGQIPHIDSSVTPYSTTIYVKIDITQNGNIYIYEKRDSFCNTCSNFGKYVCHYSIEDNKKIPTEYFKIFEQIMSSRVYHINCIFEFCTEFKKLINEKETNIKSLQNQIETNKKLISEQQKKINLLQDEIKNYEKIKLEMTSNQPYLSKYYDTDNANIIEKEDTAQIINQNNLNIFRQKYLNLTEELE